MDVRYTLDKLVLLVKVQWQYVRSLLVQLEYGCADYDRSTVQDFLALWPQVYCIDDDDKVLYLACREHPEYLKLLNKRRRKKIECILGRYTHELMPDINSYNAIISDVHRHCKPYIMDDWQEIGDSYVQLDFEQEKSFEKKFRALFGEQIELEEQLNNN